MTAEQLLAKMTLQEKAAFCSGADFWHTKAIERLGVPSVMMCDGPHGLRKQENTSDINPRTRLPPTWTLLVASTL